MRQYDEAILKGFSIDKYTILWHKEWWACKKGGDDIIFEGEGYSKVCEARHVGHEGTEVLGYVHVIRLRNLRPYEYHFIRVADDLCAARHIVQPNEVITVTQINYESKNLRGRRYTGFLHHGQRPS